MGGVAASEQVLGFGHDDPAANHPDLQAPSF
jgi:hypothetical protein